MLRLSATLPRPMQELPVELYFAPPHMTSFPLSMQPAIVAETMGSGLWKAAMLSHMLMLEHCHLQKKSNWVLTAASTSSIDCIS